MKAIFIVLLSIICINSLAQLKGLSYDKKSRMKATRTVKKLSIKVDNNYVLYIKNVKVFEPRKDSLNTYEIFDNKFVFISLFDSAYRPVSLASSEWLKSRVYIIEIKCPKNQYFVDLNKKCNSYEVLNFLDKENTVSIRNRKTKEPELIKVQKL